MIENVDLPPDFDLNGEPLPETPNLNLLYCEQFRITDLTPIAEPEPVLIINGQIVGVVADIMGIIGAPKSGKSALQYMFIAQAISDTGTISDGVDGVEVLPNVSRMAVVHIDSEQARHRHQKNVRNILKRAGLDTCPDHYRSYNIRQLDLENYKRVTTQICKTAYEKCKGIHSIWIDGGADYIPDVNIPADSNAIIKYFEWLAIEFHTAVFIIIHTNPGSEKERGNFGSQFQRKSGGTLLVKEDGETSTIELKRLRYGGAGSVSLLVFRYDIEKGYHVGCGYKLSNVDPDAKALQKISDAWKLCEKIFSGQRSFSGESTIKQIMVKRACQERTAKGIFALMNASEMILKGEDNNYRINSQYICDIQ